MAEAPASLYIIDTSALIDMRLDYPRRVFSGLWNRMAALAGEGRLMAPEEVRHEVARRDDELMAWCQKTDGLFRGSDESFWAAMTRVVSQCDYLVALDRRYAADSWVVALALREHEAQQSTLFAAECLVVTHERREVNAGARLRIPNACDHFKLPFARLVDIFVREGWEGL